MQPLQNRFAQRAADVRMAFEMTCTILIHGHGLRFSQIVQQHRHAEHSAGRRKPYCAGNVLPHVITMVDIALIASHSRQNFRKDNAKHLRVLKQHRHGAAPAQQFQQFFTDALNRHLTQKILFLKGGVRRLRRNGEPQDRETAAPAKCAAHPLQTAAPGIPHSGAHRAPSPLFRRRDL